MTVTEAEKELLLQAAEQLEGSLQIRPDQGVLTVLSPDEARTISSVLREAAEGWRPIETAPVEGRFLVPSARDPDELRTVIRFRHPRFSGYVIEQRTGIFWRPKWWMPCPPPPATETTKTEEPRHD